MLLNYFRGSANFGDALNPIIFDAHLPEFFDGDPAIEFSGIGSVLGLTMSRESKRRIIFSSGYAYGAVPKIDESFDFICVRGPLTASALKLDAKLAITDGAALLSTLKFAVQPKRFKFSFMPHWKSELKYPWRKLCDAADIHYLSPADDPARTIEAILQSEVVMAEAMHGAVVADTLRTPWIPVRAYSGINQFKWDDWTQSLGLEYRPQILRSMYQVNDFVLNGFKEKYKNNIVHGLFSPVARSYTLFQDAFLTRSTIDQLSNLKRERTYLSDGNMLRSKVEQLLERLDLVKARYGNGRYDLKTFAA